MNTVTLNKFVKDNGITIAAALIIQLKAVILMPFIIKAYGPTMYGGYVLVVSMMGIVFGLSSLGVGISAKRYLPSTGDAKARSALFFPQLMVTFGLMVLIVVGLTLADSHIRQWLFGNSVSYATYIIPAYLFCYFVYSQGCDYFRYTSRFNHMVLAIMTYPYLHIGLVFLLFYQFRLLDINVLVLSDAFAAGLVGLVSFVWIFREIGFHFKGFSLKALFQEIRLGLPLTLTVIVDFVLISSDRYLLSLFLSVSAVGYYQPACVLGSLIMILPKAMGMVVPQLLSKQLDSGDEQGAKILVDYTVKLFLALVIPYIFGALVLSKLVLVELTNADIAEQAYFIVPMMAFSSALFGLTYLMTSILFVRLMTGMMLKVNILAAAFNFIANLVLLSLYPHIVVAALTTVFSYIISFAYLHRSINKHWTVYYDFVFIRKAVISSVVMAGLLSVGQAVLTDLSPVLLLLLCVPGGILVYISGLIMLKAFSRAEIDWIKGLLLGVRNAREV
jgi:O-antigen/teichoic acid export membrane protein